jgi:hypothetical protein
MPGRSAGHPRIFDSKIEDVDGRDKPGHDEFAGHPLQQTSLGFMAGKDFADALDELVLGNRELRLCLLLQILVAVLD